METKSCGVCKHSFPISQFYRDRTRKDGRDNMCRLCRASQRQLRHAGLLPGMRPKVKGCQRLVYVPDPLNIVAREWGHITRAGQLVPAIGFNSRRAAA